MAPWLPPDVTAICDEPHQAFGLPFVPPAGELRDGRADGAADDLLGAGVDRLAGDVVGAVRDGVGEMADDDAVGDAVGTAPAPWPLPDTDELQAAGTSNAAHHAAATIRRAPTRASPNRALGRSYLISAVRRWTED